ncbi:amino acid ABC transporter permease [Garciella nitratireducens]|uniref:Amino acid ABC transporter membrane protein, PAAT family (TC 3.A.1.3.-) n=1 Tax=Garciella nitratireducens DSM 15102 TaxID=1121911 RepID=A0A1T4MA97_9FIRM|nr:amino acid ABC transporter permease [Garciella nitratireducens]RBP43964.1 amino acid ABC transporter membrane protein (PAAT family) [Garciella nitratireducens]SJZ63767.1 amino acid ABC transporter membrane protein, PAAT family (TC 3.A.1.3.-) [Garciella nitratireducens DSM 15102]
MNYIINTADFILEGSKITLSLYAITIILSIPLGILCAIAKVSRFSLLRSIIGFYTWLFRGTPLMLQLFFSYYGLGVWGIQFSAFEAASITFVLNYAAYFTEIFRGGIQSIDKGQYEAAHCLGMTKKQTMKRIIIPQAVKRVLPPLSNEAITLVKDTALVSSIALADITRNAQQIVSRDFTTIPFVLAAVFYLLFTSVVVWIFRKIERKYGFYN